MTDDVDIDVAIIGGGPAGLMAAETLAAGGVSVVIYDRMPSLGRKFLLAGRGGLNLTHSEDIVSFMSRYGSAATQLAPAIEAFPPTALRAWAEALGQETFVGTSGRVFPVAMKASPLLRAWLRRLADAGVTVRLRHRWLGLDGENLLFATPEGEVRVKARATVLALGGASWPNLGSDGGWVEPLRTVGVAIAPLRPSNCGFLTDWTETFRSRFAGQPLKRIGLSFYGQSVRGEALVTAAGIEGGAIYALSGPMRDAIAATGEAILSVDLRPDVTVSDLEQQLSRPRGKQSLSTFLRKAAQLSPVAIGLVQEAAIKASERVADLSPAQLAARIKAVPVRLTATSAITKAISSAGGVTWDEVDGDLMLRHRSGTFVAGEMLDWEAPTGGYLLQACFSTGAAAGRGALRWLRATRD
jgi:uncharacterized flavoprotein (TIGR03862 family)